MAQFQRWFEEFWNNNYYRLDIDNPTRFHDNLSAKMATFHSIEEIDDYVLEDLKSARESTRRIIEEFYNFLERKGYKTNIQSNLRGIRLCDNPFERQLLILKYLHEPRTMEEIEKYLHIKGRTIRSDLQQLEEGIKIFGSTIRVKKEKKGRRVYYKTTVHPIFLPLTLTETYALTVYLDRIVEHGDPNADMIHFITNRVKSQLSDYAYDKLYPNEVKISESNDYISDETLAHDRDYIRMYLMKSGRTCDFFWNGEKYTGKIVPDNTRDYPYAIELEDGTRLDAPIAEVDFIVDSLEYE